jgi:hypothetical protein
MPTGVVETPAKSPVCGCDHVNYWNQSVAASHGMAVNSAGECPQQGAAHCGGLGMLPCPMAKHFCDYQVQNQNACGIMDPMGICWGMPLQCPGIVVGPYYQPCVAPGNQCLTECEAIKTESTFYQDPQCPV